MILLASTTFASGITEPSLPVQRAFNRTFATANDVVWENVSELYKATFQQEGQYLTAFFNPAGRIESVARNINPDALPLLLQNGLHDKRGGAWITESFEVSGATGTSYYATVENADVKTVYRSAGSDWVLYKKTKK